MNWMMKKLMESPLRDLVRDNPEEHGSIIIGFREETAPDDPQPTPDDHLPFNPDALSEEE